MKNHSKQLYILHLCCIISLLCVIAQEKALSQNQEEAGQQNQRFQQVDDVLRFSFEVEGMEDLKNLAKDVKTCPKAKFYRYQFEPGKYVFYGVQDQSNKNFLRPVDGFYLSRSKPKFDYTLELFLIPPPFKNNATRSVEEPVPNSAYFYSFHITFKENAFESPFAMGHIGYQWIPDDVVPVKEGAIEFTTPELMSVPLDVENLDMYVAPFARKQNEQKGTYSFVIIVTEKLKSLKKFIQLNVSEKFDLREHMNDITE